MERLYDDIGKFEKKMKAAKPDPKKPAAKADPNDDKKKKNVMSDLESLQDDIKDLIDEKAKLGKLAPLAPKMKPADLEKFKASIKAWREKDGAMVSRALRLSKAFDGLDDNKDRDYSKMSAALKNSPGGDLDFDDPP